MSYQLTEQERMRRAVICVRNTLRDRPEINRLLQGQPESSDLEVRQAIIMALEDWNTSGPPLANVTLANHPAKFLLIQKAAANLLVQAATWHAREHMPSTDGGTSGDDHLKTSDYLMIADRLSAEYESKKIELKRRINVTGALGNMGAASEYGLWLLYGQELAW